MTNLVPASRELPVLDRPVDNTAMTAYMTCPWEYFASMVLHRRPTGTTPALGYGSTFHRAMEIHYKTDGDADLVHLAIDQHWTEHTRLDDHRTRDRLHLEYDNYVEKYGKPSKEEQQTLGWPEAPAVEISVNASWPGSLWPYAGKIDRLITWNGQIYVEDHKTTSRMGDNYFQQFELSNQMMGYVWLARLFTEQKVAGVRINAHGIYKRESVFERHVISYSDDRLEAWAENYQRWIDRIMRSYEHYWRMLQNGVDVGQASAESFPRNHSACSRKYGNCTYVGVCAMPPRFRMAVLEQDFEEAPWNPLEADDE